MMGEKNVIITGAAGGIGLALIRAFAANKYNIWACVHKNANEFDLEVQKISKSNDVWIRVLCFNLESDEEIKKGIQSILEEKRRIDVLCNVAGVGHMQLLELTSKREISRLFQINTLAPIYISQLVLRVMRKQHGGYIINVTSTAADESYDGNTIYGSSKAALNQFTKSLAFEIGREGIIVNAIAPGLTDTKMSTVFEGKNPDLPLQRSVLKKKANPEEIAQVIIEMCSGSMDSINGQIIKVHGGGEHKVNMRGA